MYGYNSVGVVNNDGVIKVEIEEDTPITAIFSKDKLQVGGLLIPNPTKNKEFVIKVTIKD